MDYRTKLDMLELSGVNYHRNIANYLSEQICKTYHPKGTSILVYGDNDLLVSYLLSHKFLIHVINTGLEEPRNTHRIKVVTTTTFPMSEYDILILLSCSKKCDKKFIEKYINKNSKFFIIPDNNHIEWLRKTLSYNRIPFNEIKLNINEPNNICFSNLQ